MNKLSYNTVNIPLNIDEKINTGIESALAEKKRINNKKRKCLVVASIILFTFILALGVSSPALASKLPIIGNVFQLIEQKLYFPGNYAEYSTSLNEKAYSSGVSVTLSDVLCDGQSLYLTYIVENKKPFKYTTWGNDSDLGMKQLLTADAYNKLDFTNEELYDEGFAGLEGEFIDEYTFIGVQKYSLSKLTAEIPDEFTLQTKITNIENYSIYDEDKDYSIWGTWAFKVPVKVNKDLKTTIVIDNMENSEVKVSSLAITPFDMILEMNYKQHEWHKYRIKVFDADGTELLQSYSTPSADNKTTNTILQAPKKNSKEIRIVVEKPYATKYGDTESDIILDEIIPLF